MAKTIFITGTTSGFGKACAQVFASNGWNILINGRREERLFSLKEELETQYQANVLAIPFDVQDRKVVFDTINALPNQWKQIDVLLNNAGLALGRDLFDDASLDDWSTMLDTNVKGLMYVTKAVLPFFIEKKAGHIINLGSIAGKEVYERGNGYNASKFAVDAISKGMRIDLLQHGIKVTAINPGAAETEFSLVRFKGDPEKAAAIYKGYEPLHAIDVANIIYYCATLPPHVCINDLTVTPTAQANSFYVHAKK